MSGFSSTRTGSCSWFSLFLTMSQGGGGGGGGGRGGRGRKNGDG